MVVVLGVFTVLVIVDISLIRVSVMLILVVAKMG